MASNGFESCDPRPQLSRLVVCCNKQCIFQPSLFAIAAFSVRYNGYKLVPASRRYVLLPGTHQEAARQAADGEMVNNTGPAMSAPGEGETRGHGDFFS